METNVSNFVKVFGNGYLLEYVTSMHTSMAAKLLKAKRYASFRERKECLCYVNQNEVEIASEQGVKWIFDYLVKERKFKVDLLCLKKSIPDPHKLPISEESFQWFTYVFSQVPKNKIEKSRTRQDLIFKCLTLNFIRGVEWLIGLEIFSNVKMFYLRLLGNVALDWSCSEDDLLSLTKWLIGEKAQRLFNGPSFKERWSKDILHDLFCCGYPKVALWIMTVDETLNTERLLPFILRSGSATYVEIFSSYPGYSNKTDVQGGLADIIKGACYTGNLDWVKQTCLQYKSKFTPRVLEASMRHCLKKGYIDIVNFLCEWDDPKVECVHSAALGNSVASLEWLLKRNPVLVKSCCGDSEFISKLVKKGKLKSVNWILENLSSFPIRDMLNSACENNCPDMLQLFMESKHKNQFSNLIENSLHLYVKKCYQSPGTESFKWMLDNIPISDQDIDFILYNPTDMKESKHQKFMKIFLKKFGHKVREDFPMTKLREGDFKTFSRGLKYIPNINPKELFLKAITLHAGSRIKQLARTFDLKETWKSLEWSKKIQIMTALGKESELFIWMFDLCTMKEKELWERTWNRQFQ